jgi:hypothetical protein
MHTVTLRRCTSVLLGTLLLIVSGCGKSARVWEFNNQVEGIVKLEGTPVPDVFVQFVPEDPVEQGPISTAQTDSKGHFRLMTQDDRDGAVIGKHRVLVFAGRTESGARVGINIPARYRTVKDAVGLEVTPDKHSYDVDLKR